MRCDVVMWGQSTVGLQYFECLQVRKLHQLWCGIRECGQKVSPCACKQVAVIMDGACELVYDAKYTCECLYHEIRCGRMHSMKHSYEEYEYEVI